VERVGERLKSVDGVEGLAPVRDHHTAGTDRVECSEGEWAGRGRKRRKGVRWRWYRGTEMEQLERLR